MIDRILEALKKDKTERETAKKDLPESEEQKKTIAGMMANVTALCKEVSNYFIEIFCTPKFFLKQVLP